MKNDNHKVIGSSLGQCIKDILVGHVKFTEVVMIYTNTNIQSFESLNKVIDIYSKDILAFHDKDVIRQLIHYYLFRGMIQQERVGNGLFYGSQPMYGQPWYNLENLQDSYVRALNRVFSANVNTEESGDLNDADKEYNVKARKDLQDLIDANYTLYLNRKKRYDEEGVL